MTAMMELRKTIESWINLDSEDLSLLAVIIQIDKFAKKEKEQIIDAYEIGYDNNEYPSIMQTGKEYYNQTYNQNK